MKRFKNILLVAEDSSDLVGGAAEKARELARLNNAKIKVVGTIDAGLLDLLGDRLFNQAKDLNTLAVEKFHNEIKEILTQPAWQNIPTEVEILQGKAFIAVIQQVLNHGFDLVVKQNNEAQGVDNLAMRLLRKCPCPVWLVRREDTGQFRQVLAALDIAENDEENYLLNKKILELAHSLAQREGGMAHYLHAWFLHSESMLRSPRFNYQESEIQSLKQEIIAGNREKVQKLFDHIQIMPDESQVHIVEGKTEDVLHQMIDVGNIDLLVMGTIGRTGVPGLLIGNTAESIVKDLKCSLMAVKPDGFVSPVK